MKTSLLALLAVLGISLTAATTARAEDPAPVKITPEMQAFIMQALKTISSMKGDLEALGIELPPELSQSQAADSSTATSTAAITTTTTATPSTPSTTTGTAAAAASSNSSSGKSFTPRPTLLDASAAGSLKTSHLSTSSLSINGAARLSETDWRELFTRRQP